MEDLSKVPTTGMLGAATGVEDGTGACALAASGSEARIRAIAKPIRLMTHFSFPDKNVDMRGKQRVSYSWAWYDGDRNPTMRTRRPGAATNEKNGPRGHWHRSRFQA